MRDGHAGGAIIPIWLQGRRDRTAAHPPPCSIIDGDGIADDTAGSHDEASCSSTGDRNALSAARATDFVDDVTGAHSDPRVCAPSTELGRHALGQ